MSRPFTVTHTARAVLDTKQLGQIVRQALGAPDDAQITFLDEDGEPAVLQYPGVSVEWTPVLDGRKRGGIRKSAGQAPVALAV